MVSKVIMYGGGAVAVALVGYLALSSRAGASSGGNASSDVGGGYMTPIVYSGAGSSIAPGGLDQSQSYSSDNSIAQMIAGQLATATMQSNVSMAQIASDKEIALAGYTTDLAKTKDTNQALIEKSLADQLGAIVKSFQTSSYSSSSKSGGLFSSGGSSSSGGTKGINNLQGTIGFQNGTISLDLKHDETVPKAPGKK